MSRELAGLRAQLAEAAGRVGGEDRGCCKPDHAPAASEWLLLPGQWRLCSRPSQARKVPDANVERVKEIETVEKLDRMIPYKTRAKRTDRSEELATESSVGGGRTWRTRESRKVSVQRKREGHVKRSRVESSALVSPRRVRLSLRRRRWEGGGALLSHVQVSQTRLASRAWIPVHVFLNKDILKDLRVAGHVVVSVSFRGGSSGEGYSQEWGSQINASQTLYFLFSFPDFIIHSH